MHRPMQRKYAVKSVHGCAAGRPCRNLADRRKGGGPVKHIKICYAVSGVCRECSVYWNPGFLKINI